MSKLRKSINIHRQVAPRIERLYFPNKDDPSLYQNCGKKHYSSQSSQPYAESVNSKQYVKLLKHQNLNNGDIEGSRPSLSSLSQALKNQTRFKQIQYKKKLDNQEDILDREIINANPFKPKLKERTRYETIQPQPYIQRKLSEKKIILKEKVETEPIEISQSRNNQISPKKQIENISAVKERSSLRTPSQNQRHISKVEFEKNHKKLQQILAQKKVPRFIPTFLSSLKY